MGLLGWLRVLISIHALLAESDRSTLKLALRSSYFYPRSPCGERRSRRYRRLRSKGFLSTLSLRRATAPMVLSQVTSLFLSTLSLRRATSSRFMPFTVAAFLSTLSLRRATLFQEFDIMAVSISIHALLAESDCLAGRNLSPPPDFYPRSPCGERLLSAASLSAMIYFYPRSPCGERPGRPVDGLLCKVISIHALLAESDRVAFATSIGPSNFYPRSPCGERQPVVGQVYGYGQISIHALLAESDLMPSQAWLQFPVFLSTLSLRRATLLSAASLSAMIYFYPRSPCGERPIALPSCIVPGVFLSTLSLRRATASRIKNREYAKISIHALLAESDLVVAVHALYGCGISIHALLAESDASDGAHPFLPGNFYPRSPCGERRAAGRWSALQSDFYPRSPCGERPPLCPGSSSFLHFYPRSPCGERLMGTFANSTRALFLSTLSLRRATAWKLATRLCTTISIHALLAESDPGQWRRCPCPSDFYPRSPCGERPSG